MITDYDCWHPEHASVTLEEIISNLNKNAENAQNVIREAVRAMPAERACKCGSRPGARDCYRSRRDSGRGAQAPERHRRKISEAGSPLKMSLLVVGSVAFDAVETPHGKVDRMLGGAATYFSVAASYFTHVNLVGIVGTDFTEKDESIFKRPPRRYAGPRTRRRKDVFLGREVQRKHERAHHAGDGIERVRRFQAEAARSRTKPRHTFFSPISIRRCKRSVLHQVKRRPKVVALDTMNYWIERTPKELRETLKHTDILVINDSETRQLSNEHNLLRAARHIFKLGPKALVIKRGEYGAMLVHQNRTFNVPAFPLEQVHDPTGAGDTFAGGFMGYLASVPRSGRRGAAPRHGLRLGDGQLHGGKIRPGPPANPEKLGNHRPGPAFSQDDAVHAVSLAHAAGQPHGLRHVSSATAKPVT